MTTTTPPTTETTARGGTTAAPAPFDPRPYLAKLQDGREYLHVAHRLLWLRAEHPEAIITTQLLHFDWQAGWFLFHARVEIPGLGVAEGTGSETRESFPKGPCEKAETVAIGRALAALGYGTAFALADFEEGRLADSPVGTPTPTTTATTSTTPPANGTGAQSRPTAPAGNGNGNLATGAQLKLIYLTATRDLHATEEELEEQCQAMYGRLPVNLTKAEASQFIDTMRAAGNRRA